MPDQIDMSDVKPATVWWCLESLFNPAEIVQLTLDVGYQGIEMVPEEEFSRATDAGLTLVSHRGHGWLEDGLNNPANHDRIEQEILDNLQLAQTWSIPYLICFSGNRNGLNDKVGAVNTAAGLARVANAAEQVGVTLVVELLNSKVDHPDYQCDHTSWGMEVVDIVKSPAVKLLYDIYHMQIMEGDLVRTIQEQHAYFGHYHLAGNPGRNEPDASQEINYSPVLAAIRKTGFDGWMGMEYLPTCDAAASLRHAGAL